VTSPWEQAGDGEGERADRPEDGGPVDGDPWFGEDGEATPRLEVDVLIVGGGPAGLAAAVGLRALGAHGVRVIDRERVLGGVPRHARHAGFGLCDLGRPMLGPDYARHRVELAERAGAELCAETSATGWVGDLTLRTTSPRGIEDVRARAVLLATGCRERSRAARQIPGTRPLGVYTTGALQRLVYLQGVRPGRRAVVVGAEAVSFSALRTLRGAGVELAALVTAEPRARALPWVRAARPAVVETDTRVTRIDGTGRVEAVELEGPGGARTVACDTVVFTGEMVPEHELARLGGLALDPATRGPIVGAGFMTRRRGVFAAGNLLRGDGSAYTCVREGEAAARALHRWLTSAILIRP